MEKMMNNKMSRASVPGRIVDLLWADDEFCRDVSGHKKVSSSGKFPKTDQWCSEEGLHVAFALVGYSPGDVSVVAEDNMLIVNGVGSNSDTKSCSVNSEADEYPPKPPKSNVQQGIIVRGIARRNFKTKLFVNPLFSPANASATMRDGLLEIFVPKRNEVNTTSIEIKEI